MDYLRKIKKITAVASLSILAVAPSNAGELGIQDFISLAQRNNYDIRIAEENLRSAEGRKAEAFGAFFPQLAAGYSQNYINRPTEMEFSMPLPGPGGSIIYETASISMGQKDNYQAQVSMNMPLFTGGALRNAHRMASEAYEIEKEKYRSIELNVTSGIRRAFYGYILASEIKEIIEYQNSKFEDNLKTTERLFRSGAASSLDVSLVKVQLANTRSALIDAENELRIARERLFSISGLKDNGEIVYGELRDGDFSGELDEFIRLARVSRPEIEILRIASEIQRLNRRIERSVTMPKIIGHAGYVFERPYLNEDKWGDYWMAGLAVEIPFLDGLSVFGREKRTKADYTSSQIEKEKVSEGVRLEVTNSYYSILSAREKLSVQEENLILAKNNMKVSEKRYSAGLLSNLELNQAVLEYTGARIQNALTRFEFLSALEGLKTAVGKELEF